MRMLELGKITQEQYEAAKSEPIATRHHGADIMLNAAYIGEMARKYMVDKYVLLGLYFAFNLRRHGV